MSPRALTTLACGSFILFLSIGARQGFGLFLPQVTTELSFGREAFAFAVAVQYLVWGAFGPVCGVLADRFGPRRTVVVGGVLYAAGFALASQAGGSESFALSAGVLIGLGLGGASFGVVNSAVAKAVDPEQIGTALGVVAAATAFGQFILLFYTQISLDVLGWRGSMLAHSALVAPIAVLALGLELKAKTALRTSATGARLTTPAPEGTDYLHCTSGLHAIRQAAKTRNFWLLCAGFSFSGFQVMFTMTHLPAYVNDLGMDSQMAVNALAVVSFTSFFGSWLAGRLADQFSKYKLLSFIYAARAGFALLAFAFPPSKWSLLVYFAALGFFWMSTIPVASALTAELFGTRYLASIFSTVFFIHQIGGFAGTWLGGLVFDAFANYKPMWVAIVFLCGAGSLLSLAIRPRTSAEG